MQLLSVIVWGWNGEHRTVPFKPGTLNVITGDSRTGKSALLDIVDYCFGQREEGVAGQVIRDRVAWYGIQLAVNDTVVLIARPRPEPGRQTNARVMLVEVDGSRIPEFAELSSNTDTSNLRRRLSQIIGIGEFRADVGEDSLSGPTVASIAHAILLCIQKQGEVSNPDLLFHHQGERYVAEALVSTFPYLLGAEAWDQAVWQARAKEARRSLAAAANRLRASETRDTNIESELRGLVEEAFAVGLIPSSAFQSREQAIADLTRISNPSTPLDRPSATQDGRADLQRTQTAIRRQLRAAYEERNILLDLANDEAGFRSAIEKQSRALRPLDLLGPDIPDLDPVCPVCGQETAEPDATVTEMRAFAAELGSHLEGLTASAPRRELAVTRVEALIRDLQERLASTEAALLSTRPEDRASTTIGATRVEELSFHRGRIDASLRVLAASTGDNLERARSAVRAAERTLNDINARLDTSDTDLQARLTTISQHITEYARLLDVAHSDRPVVLDIRRLTARVSSTDTDTLRLNEVGSAANYLGLHLAVHLGLHRFLTDEGQPIPRFLLLDQPSQPFYPEDQARSDAATEAPPTRDTDREAVIRMYELLRDFTASLDGQFQIIVSDHLNLKDADWFQDAIVEVWRNGKALVPDDWPVRPTPLPNGQDDATSEADTKTIPGLPSDG